jgi:phosphatidylglycerol:prolipoprotein diacylglycerol transferase
MIPFFSAPSLRFGPVTIHAFGLIVALAVLAGLTLGARRFERVGLDRSTGERMAGWVIVGGLAGAHLFSVAFYFPDKVAENPLVLLKFWEDISSFGSILGGALAIALFTRLRAGGVLAWSGWASADVVAYVFPLSLMVGRLACGVAHDHPGRLTRFPLGISLRSPEAQSYIAGVYERAGLSARLPSSPELGTLAFHDLGWYEFLYLALFVVPVILWLARRPRAPGVFVAAFLALYMPIRFLLDFLRVSDVRYGPLTPAQWIAACALLFLPWLIRGIRRRAVPSPIEIRPSPATGELAGEDHWLKTNERMGTTE